MLRGKAGEQCLWRGWKEKQDMLGRRSLEREVRLFLKMWEERFAFWLLQSEEAKRMENGKKSTEDWVLLMQWERFIPRCECTATNRESRNPRARWLHRNREEEGKWDLLSILAWATGWGVLLFTEWGKVCWVEE